MSAVRADDISPEAGLREASLRPMLEADLDARVTGGGDGFYGPLEAPIAEPGGAEPEPVFLHIALLSSRSVCGAPAVTPE